MKEIDEVEKALQLGLKYAPKVLDEMGLPTSIPSIQEAQIEDGLTALAKIRERGEWRPIAEDDYSTLPQKPGIHRYEQIACLVYHKGETVLRVWNCEHLCWDDAYGDDYFCDPFEPTHWRPLPPSPDDS